MPQLLVEKGPDRGKTYTLTVGQSVIVGRDTAVPIAINDPMASRRHAVIGERRGQWLVKDLESANGTIVNGKPLESGKVARINDGETFQIGDTLFSFSTGGDIKDDPLIGTEVGGYRVDKRLGRGAMGTVYQAHQLSLGREVALKVLAHDLVEDEKFTSMFVKEARAAAALNHPNILQVYDVGEADGQFFMSMEIAEGGSVLEELRGVGQIELDRSIEIIRDSLAALQYAERKDIVHRDIKPDNLMIGADSVVKLGDLGLAAPTAELQATQTGVFGTPHYIAPEQAMGKPVDHRADIYALGATWYRILSGRTLFTGADVREILKRQVREQHKPLTEVTPGIPQAVSDIVDRMLAKQPDERYQSASEVLHDIDNYLLNRNASKEALALGRSPKTLLMGGADGKPNWPMLIGVAVLLLGAIGAGLWFFVLSGDEKPDPKPDVVDTPDPDPNTDKVEKGESPQETAAKALYEQAAAYLEGDQIELWLRQLETVIQKYPKTNTAKMAQRDIDDHNLEQKNKKIAYERLKQKLIDEADAVLKRSEQLARSYKVVAIKRGWDDFVAKYIENEQASEIIAGLDQAGKNNQFVLTANLAFSEALSSIDRKADTINQLADDETVEAIRILGETITQATELRDLTDSVENQERAQALIDELQRTKTEQEEWKKQQERRAREEAATATVQSFGTANAAISAALQKGDIESARTLLTNFLKNDEGWQQHSATYEYREMRTLVADRQHQTDAMEAGRTWLAKHWETGFVTIVAPDKVLDIAPDAQSFKLRRIISERDGDAKQEFLYRYSDGNAQAKDGSMRWDSMDLALWPRILDVAFDEDGDGIYNSSELFRSLNTSENENAQLGIGAMLLEFAIADEDYAASRWAYRMIQPLQRRYEEQLRGKAPEELDDKLRRIKEYMGWAILGEALRAQAEGNMERQRTYRDLLQSQEYAQTRAAQTIR